MINAYPEKPIVPYERTSVEMGAVVAFLKAQEIPAEVKRIVYIIFRNESGNGKSGVCHNYGGIQADSGRWPSELEALITGVVEKRENKQSHGGGIVRYFVAFATWESSVYFLIHRVIGRGMFIGGVTEKVVRRNIVTVDGLCEVYYKAWVTGQAAYTPSELQVRNFKSMYAQAEKLFV